MDLIIKKTLTLFFCVLILFGCKQKDVFTPVQEVEKTYKTLILKGEEYEYNTSLKFILLAGLDNNEFKGQTDFLGLFVFDRNNETFKIINIPREMLINTSLYDSYNNFLTETETYVNLIYSLNGEGFQGASRLVGAISSIINEIPVSNFLITPLESIEKTLLVAEGLEYTIPNSSLEYLNPTWKEGTVITINKENIYKILRARDTKTDNSALLRRERQNTFIKLLKEKTSNISLENIPINDFLENSVSNFTLDEYENFYDMLISYDFNGFIELPGVYSDNGLYDEFSLDEHEMLLLIKENFYM